MHGYNFETHQRLASQPEAGLQFEKPAPTLVHCTVQYKGFRTSVIENIIVLAWIKLIKLPLCTIYGSLI